MSRQKKNNLIPLVALVGGGLLLIVAAFMLANQTPAAAPEAAFVEEVYPEIQRVSIDEAKAALDSGSAVFVDVRSAEAYQASHISGAVNIPSEELEARLGELDKAQWIITYCT
ncbi:MAG: hypothetical protein IPO22_21695 [Anaerolineales bacterium]|jgi:3-mercaptopyruvate sulfurtransferase SseA|nr:hypothetical protein [Anaerolineales bacterium]